MRLLPLGYVCVNMRPSGFEPPLSTSSRWCLYQVGLRTRRGEYWGRTSAGGTPGQGLASQRVTTPPILHLEYTAGVGPAEGLAASTGFAAPPLRPLGYVYIADQVGFEPTVLAFATDGFGDRPLRPLGH